MRIIAEFLNFQPIFNKALCIILKIIYSTKGKAPATADFFGTHFRQSFPGGKVFHRAFAW